MITSRPPTTTPASCGPCSSRSTLYVPASRSSPSWVSRFFNSSLCMPIAVLSVRIENHLQCVVCVERLHPLDERVQPLVLARDQRAKVEAVRQQLQHPIPGREDPPADDRLQRESLEDQVGGETLDRHGLVGRDSEQRNRAAHARDPERLV